jgi:hypothetical protein
MSTKERRKMNSLTKALGFFADHWQCRDDCPEINMIASIVRKRLVASIVVVIFATAVIGGYVFNMMPAQE